jgi:hypothetical protein
MTVTTASDPYYDPKDPTTAFDPHPVFRRLCDDAPLRLLARDRSLVPQAVGQVLRQEPICVGSDPNPRPRSSAVGAIRGRMRLRRSHHLCRPNSGGTPWSSRATESETAAS